MMAFISFFNLQKALFCVWLIEEVKNLNNANLIIVWIFKPGYLVGKCNKFPALFIPTFRVHKQVIEKELRG